MDEEKSLLPTGWKKTNLGQIVELSKEKIDPNTCPNRPYISLKYIESNSNRILECGKAEDVKSNQNVFRNGDILYGRLRPYLNKVCMPNFSGVCSTDILVFSKTKTVENNFLVKYISQESFVQYAHQNSSGINLPRVSFAALSEYQLDLPPLNEQKRIADKIEALQTKSNKAKKALETAKPLLDKLRQSILAAAFRGDLTADWRKKTPDVEPASILLERIRKERRKRWEETELAKMKAKGKEPKNDKWKDRYKEPEPVDTTGLPELPKGWCWAKWEQIGFSQNGRAFPSKHYTTKGTKLLRPGNLHISGSLEWNQKNTQHMPQEWEENHPLFVIGPNELTMNLTAQSLKDDFLGRICLTGEREHCLLNQRLARLTPVILHPKFCFWLFKSPPFRRYVDSLNTGTLIQHMFTSQVYEFVFPLPPEKEQRVLSVCLDDFENMNTKMTASISNAYEKLAHLNNSILVKAFQGELVPQDPSDEPASVLLERIKAEREAIKPKKKTTRKRKTKVVS